MGWWRFWSPRSPHIIPALRGFNLPKMNLAEVGQSTMRGHGKMWLTEAAYRDIAAIALQSSNYKKFRENRERIMGRGPSLKKKTARENESERKFVKQIDDVLFSGNLANEARKQFQRPFTPSIRAKHRAPRNVLNPQQGKYADEQDDDVIIIEQPRKNPQRPGRGKNARYSQNPVNINPRSEDDYHQMVPDEMEKKFLKANRVY